MTIVSSNYLDMGYKYNAYLVKLIIYPPFQICVEHCTILVVNIYLVSSNINGASHTHLHLSRLAKAYCV
jgi:hypothetical protein